MAVYFDSDRSKTLRRIGFVLVLAVVLALAWSVWMRNDDARDTQVGVMPDATKPQGSEASAALRGARPERTDVVEIDMLGTRMDVSRLFQLGFGGGLQVDRQTREALDTLLLTLPEKPSPEELQKLEYTLRQGMPKEEAERALKMFQGYRSYQVDMRAQGNELGIPSNAQAVDDYFVKVAQIQRRHFDDATASALFGQEMQQARLVMMAAVIDQNQNLTLEQKKEQLDALRAQLPDGQKGLIPEASTSTEPEAK